MTEPEAIPTQEQQTGISLIAGERQRQVNEKGWTPEHDRQHVDGELAQAAVRYAMPRWLRDVPILRTTLGEVVWPRSGAVRGMGGGTPWDFRSAADSEVRDLVKAGALIAAEIDRLLAEGAS